MDENAVEKPLFTPKLPRWWRALPSLIILSIISTIDSLILNDYVEYRYANLYQLNSTTSISSRELCLNATRTIHNGSEHKSTTPSLYSTTITMSPSDLIQTSTARLNVYMSLAATIPAIITSIILGANCDRIGRKPLIAIPYIGKIIRYCILAFTVYYDLPDFWIILSNMFDGLFGTISLNILSTFAYVTDCTNEKTRTSAIIITDVCIGCGQFLPLLLMGMYLQHPNFIQSMIFTGSLSLAGFIYVILLQPESNLNVQHLNIFQQLKQTKIKEVKNVFQVFFVKRQQHRQRSLLMLVTIHLTIIVALCGYIAMYYLYLYGQPFCLDSFGVSLNKMAQTVSIVILTILFTLTLAKKTDHLVLPVLGSFSFIVHLILFGIAKQVWILYLATCVGSIYYVLTPIIRSRITKLVEPDEYAVVFILAGVFESGGYFAISAAVNAIYQASLLFFSGLVYFVIAVVAFISILLMCILYILEYPAPSEDKSSLINN